METWLIARGLKGECGGESKGQGATSLLCMSNDQLSAKQNVDDIDQYGICCAHFY